MRHSTFNIMLHYVWNAIDSIAWLLAWPIAVCFYFIFTIGGLFAAVAIGLQIYKAMRVKLIAAIVACLAGLVVAMVSIRTETWIAAHIFALEKYAGHRDEGY